MIYAIYDITTGQIERTVDVPDFMKDSIELNSNQSIFATEKLLHNGNYFVDNGVISLGKDDDITVHKKHLDNQALMWERIKQLRLDKMIGGVYVASIDKYLHSDEVSSIQYAQIGTAITMGMFQPMNWKAMDGDFIELTESIFRELQVAMIVNTQTIYAKAEYHKYMMMQSDDPLSYDYNEGW